MVFAVMLLLLLLLLLLGKQREEVEKEKQKLTVSRCHLLRYITRIVVQVSCDSTIQTRFSL